MLAGVCACRTEHRARSTERKELVIRWCSALLSFVPYNMRAVHSNNLRITYKKARAAQNDPHSELEQHNVRSPFLGPGEESAEAEPAVAALFGGFLGRCRRGGGGLALAPHLVQDGVRLQQLLLFVQRAEDGVEQALLLHPLTRRRRDELGRRRRDVRRRGAAHARRPGRRR